MHPSEPWLAVAGTDVEGERGAVMVFDVLAGALRSVALTDEYVGWSDPGLLRWHCDGRRIATNVGTNGIALLNDDRWVGRAYPDDTRDSGVGYLWLGDRLFADTGAFFEIEPGDARFEFDELDAPEFQAMEWNASIGAVVGRVGSGVAAYDPIGKRAVYENTLEVLSPRGTPRWAPDGRWCVSWHAAVAPNSDALLFVNGDTGEVHGRRQPSSPRVRELAWATKGALAVSCHVHHVGGKPSDVHVDIFRAGERRATIDLADRRIQASHSVAEASGIAWSPAADGLALLLDHQEVRVFDAQSGDSLSSFKAPAAPIPPGLPDYYTRGHKPPYGFPGDLMWVRNQRLVRVAPHFVSFWSMDGQKVAEFVVPE